MDNMGFFVDSQLNFICTPVGSFDQFWDVFYFFGDNWHSFALHFFSSEWWDGMGCTRGGGVTNLIGIGDGAEADGQPRGTY